MVPPAPQIRWKTLNYDGKHMNIVIFAMFWRYSWYLQRLKYDGNHMNIGIFAMFWRYSQYLQRLKYDRKHKKIVVFAMFWRYQCMQNTTQTLNLCHPSASGKRPSKRTCEMSQKEPSKTIVKIGKHAFD